MAVLNLPNKITVGRIGLTFLMAGFLTSGLPFGKTLALITFGLAGLSDWLDGMLARRLNKISIFGQLMDPLADKILVCAAFVSFVAIDQIVPAWIAITIISREFVVTGLRLLASQKGRVLPAGPWGKHKMIWQTITIVVIMLGLALKEEILPLLLGVGDHARFMVEYEIYFISTVKFLYHFVAALTAISGVIYLWDGRDLYMEHT
ncbi:MAG: CDP-diacylglycerol--glycerol-3-phosphate 3-phosphatidyltransferase [bacterium]